MADKNVSHFAILISHSRPKYVGNMKWLTKIANGRHFGQPFFIG
jgi:hypothetical protein